MFGVFYTADLTYGFLSVYIIRVSHVSVENLGLSLHSFHGSHF